MFKIGETKGIENDLQTLMQHFKYKFHLEVNLGFIRDGRLIIKHETIKPPQWRVKKYLKIENIIWEEVKMYGSIWSWSIAVPDLKNPGYIITLLPYKRKNSDILGFAN